MTAAIWVFAGFALLCYPALLFFNLLVSPESADSLEAGFAGFGTTMVCLNLSIALLLMAIRDGARWWFWIIGPLVMILYVASAAGVPDLIKDHQPVKWMLVVPITGPIIVFAYIAWAMFPRLHSLLSPNPAAALLCGALFGLMLIPSSRQSQLTARKDAAEKAWQAPIKARIQQLKQTPPDAPIADFLPFIGYSETNDEAMKRIATSKRRQTDFEQMINAGDDRFFYMADKLDLAPTPALCECVRGWLRHKVAVAKSGADDPTRRFVSYNASDVEALAWFADHKCDILQDLAPYEALLRSYPDADEKYLRSTFDRLAAMKRTLGAR